MFSLPRIIKFSQPLLSTSLQSSKLFFATVPKEAAAAAAQPKRKAERRQYDPKEVKEFINKIVTENPVMLFMKGTPSNPMCGFSYKAVQILKTLGSDFASANILTSEAVKDGLKEVSHWQTYPQLFIKGEFVGGCDIMMQLYESGELKKMLEEAGSISNEETSKSKDESKEQEKKE
ncbi:hypothetical protein WA158_000283 [Blastocystis sp. Blastoise]